MDAKQIKENFIKTLADTFLVVLNRDKTFS